MERDAEAALTTRLPDDLEGVQRAQGNQAEVEPHVHKVETTRSELKANAQAQ